MIQYIKVSCLEWILAELKRGNDRVVWGGYRYYLRRVYECTGLYRCSANQNPVPEFDELVAWYAVDEL